MVKSQQPQPRKRTLQERSHETLTQQTLGEKFTQSSHWSSHEPLLSGTASVVSTLKDWRNGETARLNERSSHRLWRVFNDFDAWVKSLVFHFLSIFVCVTAPLLWHVSRQAIEFPADTDSPPSVGTGIYWHLSWLSSQIGANSSSR